MFCVILMFFSLTTSIARPYNSGLTLQIPTSSQAAAVSWAFINDQLLSTCMILLPAAAQQAAAVRTAVTVVGRVCHGFAEFSLRGKNHTPPLHIEA